MISIKKLYNSYMIKNHWKNDSFFNIRLIIENKLLIKQNIKIYEKINGTVHDF